MTDGREVFPPSEGPGAPQNGGKVETVGIEPTQGSRHLDPDAAEVAVAECLRRDFRTTLRSAPVTARTAARRVIAALENAGFNLTAAAVPAPTTEKALIEAAFDVLHEGSGAPLEDVVRDVLGLGFAAGRAAATPDPPPFFTEQQERALARCEAFDAANPEPETDT